MAWRQSVAVVEDFAQLGFFLVGGDHLGLDRDRAPDQLRQHVTCRVQRGLRVGLDEVQDHRVGDEPGLDHFGHPGDDFVARQRFQGGQVDQDGERLMKGTDQVLAGVGVDAGLAADGRVDHAEQRGRHMHDRDAAQPGGRRETRDVGGSSAAEADQGVLAANPDAAQHFPDETDDRQLLARLGVGDLDAVRVDALVGQVAADRLGGLGQHRLMQDRDPVPAAEQLAQLVEQSGADHHRVRRVDGHLHGDRSVDSVMWLPRHRGYRLLGVLQAWQPGHDVARPPRRDCGGWCRPGWSRRAGTAECVSPSGHGTSRRGRRPASRGRTVVPPVRRTPSRAPISK